MANTTNWLNISSQSGSSGETILTLSAQRNLSTNYKTAEITAYNPVYNISAKTYVTIESYSPYIEVEPVIVGVPESGGTYQLSISSNCAYVIAYPDLVASYSTSAATGNTTITFSVTGTSADTTLVGNIVLTDESGQVSKTVRVEQYGQGAQISYWPGYLNFPASGGSGNIGVSANCVYTVTKSEGADWFSVSPSSGYTGRTDFTVTMTGENTGSSPLSGYVFINGPGNAGGVVEIRQNAAETRLVVGYYVTSTTEPTVILNNVGGITTAEYPNGTQITPANAYTFPSTGMQYVYYTVSGNAVPDSFLDSIGSYAALSDTVRSVFIPNSYTGIGFAAFYDCSSLSSITLGNGITAIGYAAFEGCTSLSSITLPESMQTIGAWCFVNCSNLTEIVIPSAVTSIGSNCFSGSSVETFYFSSPTPPTLGNTTALTSSNLQEIIVPCVYYNAYVSAWPQYERYMTCQDTELYFITDTSNVKGIGETRTITILNTNINPNRTGLNLPSDFPAQGSYTVSGNTIYLTYPRNPSTSATRTWTIGVLAQTNDGVSLSGSYRITQDANTIYSIPYTADTSTVSSTGETRTITIDTSNLIASSITIGIQGATGITYTFSNGIITIVFPENAGDGPGSVKHITVTISATTLNGYEAYASVNYTQNYRYIGETRLKVIYRVHTTDTVLFGGTTGVSWSKVELADGTDITSQIRNGNHYSFPSKGYYEVYLTIQGGRTVIPYPFSGVSDIYSIEIPNNITEIPWSCFAFSGLRCITIGSGVSYMGGEVFNMAHQLDTIVSKMPSTPSHPTTNPFEGIDTANTVTVYYPYGSDYSEWENFKYIKQAGWNFVESGNCDCDSVIGPFKTRFKATYYVTSTTETYKLSSLAYGSYIAKAQLPDGTDIYSTDYTFPTTGVQTVYFYIAKEEEKVPNLMFMNVPSLLSIEIPEGFTTMGSVANCAALSSVTLPDSITEIGRFSGCTSLKSFVIPRNVTALPNNIFNGCSSLKNIISLPVTAPSVTSGTFYNIATGGTLNYPAGSDYSSWLKTTSYYLGQYGWNTNNYFVEPTYAEVPSEGGVAVFTISTPSSWELIYDEESWVSYSQYSGESGVTTIYVTLEENTGTTIRDVQFFVSSSGMQIELVVSQKKPGVWVEITSGFSHSTPFRKIRWDISKYSAWSSYTENQTTYSANGFLSETPNVNCDGLVWSAVTGSSYGYAGQNRFTLRYDNVHNEGRMFSSRGNFTDRKITTYATQVSENIYEYTYPRALYWAGIGNSVLPYSSSGGTGVYVYVEE